MKTKIYLLALVLTSFLASCGGDDDDDDNNNDLESVRVEIQLNTGNSLILSAYEGLESSTTALSEAANRFQAEPTQINLETIRTVLRSAWTDWQSASFYQFGPAEEIGLRSLMNTYPTDEDQISSNIAAGSYILESLDNRDAVGFPAVDYLLNGTGSTDEEILDYFTEATLGTSRLQYLVDVASALSSNSEEVNARWSTGGGNYLAEFTASEGSGTDVGSTLSLIVNALNFHFERFTRDGKIGIPAGVRSAGVPRPTAVEVLHGEYSVDLLIANLQALEGLFLGEASGLDGAGLSDYLVALGEEQLAQDIQTQMTTVINQSQQLSSPLPALIESDNDQLLNLFTEMQALVVLLKTDMPSVMGISITFQDNDGD